MMFARSVTPAKAGAYTHIGSLDETRNMINADRSKGMDPGLRRDDAGVRDNRLRAFAPSRLRVNLNFSFVSCEGAKVIR